MVHADDVAEAIVRALEGGVSGAFNLAADPPVSVLDIATALGARHVHVPRPVVRAAVSALWHARLQPVDPGWIDLAYDVPMLSSAKAARELGWHPSRPGAAVLDEVVAGMVAAEHGTTEILRARTVARGLGEALRHGPVTRRRTP
jgi:nucleoside-diphosphate-sugar epimerase